MEFDRQRPIILCLFPPQGSPQEFILRRETPDQEWRSAMRQRKAIGLWLCLVLILGFVAATPARAQTITLEFWMPGQEPTIRSTMEGLIKKFEAQNPRVKVNYTQVPWSEWFTKLTAAIAGNLTPDISGLGYGQFGMLVGKDVFAEMSLDPADRQDIADWALKVGSYRGKLYAFLLP